MQAPPPALGARLLTPAARSRTWPSQPDQMQASRTKKAYHRRCRTPPRAWWWPAAPGGEAVKSPRVLLESAGWVRLFCTASRRAQRQRLRGSAAAGRPSFGLQASVLHAAARGPADGAPQPECGATEGQRVRARGRVGWLGDARSPPALLPGAQRTRHPGSASSTAARLGG